MKYGTLFTLSLVCLSFSASPSFAKEAKKEDKEQALCSVHKDEYGKHYFKSSKDHALRITQDAESGLFMISDFITGAVCGSVDVAKTPLKAGKKAGTFVIDNSAKAGNAAIDGGKKLGNATIKGVKKLGELTVDSVELVGDKAGRIISKPGSWVAKVSSGVKAELSRPQTTWEKEALDSQSAN